MTVSLAQLDAHEQPSAEMRSEWKHFSRLDRNLLTDDARIDDPRAPLSQNGFREVGRLPQAQIAKAFNHLGCQGALDDIPIISHPLLPGLLVVPKLLPPQAQKVLLAKMLHRDLSDPKHQTNMHLHYTLPYQDLSPTSSFFNLAPDLPGAFEPKDASVHKPLTPRQVLNRRLHWVTLGGQYDWTNRVYPDSEPPRFPADLAQFLESLFPETLAQAAIVNLYSPGDTMMMHRDVSEEADKGLVSLSLGCDGLFMIAPNEQDGYAAAAAAAAEDKRQGEKKYLLLRLRSGDAIYMTRESRYAWHGVPKVVKDTCPDHLQNWPAEHGQFAEWKGWMKNKRVNLNVRQVRE